MIQFHENAFTNLVQDTRTQPVKLTNIPSKNLQGLLNLLVTAKGLNISIDSAADGLIVVAEECTSKKKPKTVDASSIIVENDIVIEAEMFHKTDTSSAELRYFPMLDTVLFIKNKTKYEFIGHNDDGDIFSVSTEAHSRSIKQVHLPVFFPKLAAARKNAEDIINASNKARNVQELAVGDTVNIRSFADMVAEFGETVYPIGDGKEVRLTAIIPGYTNIAFLNTAEYLSSRTFTVHAILEGQEVILADEEGATEFRKLVDPTSGEEQELDESIRFSRLHLTK